jgi:chaperonin GroEL
LNDIAILTGATVISEEQGHSFASVDGSFIGSARKIIVTKDDTTIVEGAGKSSEIKARIAQINEQIKLSTSDYDKTELEKRRAALSGKVAVIKVGGETEIEEKKYRVDDAVAAVKAAMDEGIVAGGGVTLVNLAGDIKPLADETENAGAQLLARSLEKPFRILMENSGLNADEWLPKVKAGKLGQGVDVNNPSKLVDMKKAGIVDPVLVTKQAVQNAVSIAGTSMTMGALVADVPEKEEVSSGGGMGGGMGMM